MTSFLETILGSLEQKKQYRDYKARMDALPEPYTTAATALHRYLMYYAGITDGQTSVDMMRDLVELWERASADSTPVRDIIGDEPVEFAETFAQAYSGTHWIDKERARLTAAITELDRGSQHRGQP